MERKNLQSQTDAIKAHEDAMIDAMGSGKWMAAVWKVDDGKIYLTGRTTWEFPVSDMIPAVNLLRDDCQKEVNTVPELAFGSVLPRACDVGRRQFGVVNTDEPAKNEIFMEVHQKFVENGMKEVHEEINKALENTETPGIRTYNGGLSRNIPVSGDDSNE